MNPTNGLSLLLKKKNNTVQIFLFLRQIIAMDPIHDGHVKVERRNGVSHVEFFHPSHNSLPGSLLAKLKNAIQEESVSNETKVILLKSGGNRTFCAGASFDELMQISDYAEGKEFFMGFARVINACRKSSKFIVGRVQGKAIGGGVGLASAVDYCFGTQFSSIKLSELALGIGPFVVGPAVRRKIGTASFGEMTIHARGFKTAQWAWQRGLYAEVFKDAEEMDSHIDQQLEELCSYSSEAMQELKRVLWRGCENWDQLLEERAEKSGKLILSEEAKSALAAIKNK